jgi:hypothetical protein
MRGIRNDMAYNSPVEIAAKVFADKLRSTRSSFSEIDTDKKWNEGDLSYKFWPVQKRMAEILTSEGSLKKVLNCSRRLRKTTTALVKAIELGIKKERALIRFAAPTRDMLVTIIEPIMSMICQDAPEDLKPVWQSSGHHYLFPRNGSQLFVAGCDNLKTIGRLRGSAADLCVVDEAQEIVYLKYLVDDVLMPQLLGIDKARGNLWILFTPPKTPIHDCFTYAQEAKQEGCYAEFDIYEGEYSDNVIDVFKKEAGGEASTTWKREYLCQAVVDTNFSIVPEWKDEFVQEYIPDDFYKFYHKYVGMDIGVRDKTVNIFGTYDFKKGKLYIQDEEWWSGPQMTTQTVADGIKKKEKELWNDMKTNLRISDNNNLILLQDLGLLHGIHFSPTTKDTLEAMVNDLRLWISRGSLIVSPKCTQLIGCLRYGVWNDKRVDWERSTVYGHFDALAALMYLVRYVDKSTNPIPKFLGVDEANTFINREEREMMSNNAEAIKKAFRVKKQNAYKM